MMQKLPVINIEGKDVKKFPAIAKYNECKGHGATCAGHANVLTDSTYETEAERKLLLQCLDNYAYRHEGA